MVGNTEHIIIFRGICDGKCVYNLNRLLLCECQMKKYLEKFCKSNKLNLWNSKSIKFNKNIWTSQVNTCFERISMIIFRTLFKVPDEISFKSLRLTVQLFTHKCILFRVSNCSISRGKHIISYTNCNCLLSFLLMNIYIYTKNNCNFSFI